VLTVGQLAKHFGLSRSTLLYYDRIGLLRPTTGGCGNYRRYSEEDQERLSRICSYRDAGVPLKDIVKILDSPGSSALTTALESRMENLHCEMEVLRGQQRIVAGLLGRPDLLDTKPIIDKKTWTSLLEEAGFTEEDMCRWHRDFEARAPKEHEAFLELLGIDEGERQAIRDCATVADQD